MKKGHDKGMGIDLEAMMSKLGSIFNNRIMISTKEVTIMSTVLLSS